MISPPLDEAFDWRGTYLTLANWHQRLVERGLHLSGREETNAARLLLADVVDPMRHHRRDQYRLPGRELSRLVAQARFDGSGEDQNNLLGAIGVRTQLMPWLNLEVHDRGAFVASGRIEGEVHVDAHGRVLLVPGFT